MELSEGVVKTEESEHEGPVSQAPNQFRSSDDLCNHLKGMRAQEIQGGIRLKWQLGNLIRGYYKAENGYGKDELGKIGRKSGWSKSTLQKACQFAEKFSYEQVETLLGGRFTLAWRDIAQNLCLETQVFIDVYAGAQTPKELRNAVIQLRQPLPGGTPPPKRKTRKELELERVLVERDQKIADLENRIKALEASFESSTSSDELMEPEEIEDEIEPVRVARRPEFLKALEENSLAA
jgi:hypothetical protein